MRAVVDVLDNVTGVVRFMIGAVVLVGLGISLFLTAGVSYVAPKVAADLGERATEVSERAMIEAREQRRERELASEGWGYGSANSGPVGASSVGSGPVSSGRRAYANNGGDDWGEGAR